MFFRPSFALSSSLLFLLLPYTTFLSLLTLPSDLEAADPLQGSRAMWSSQKTLRSGKKLSCRGNLTKPIVWYGDVSSSQTTLVSFVGWCSGEVPIKEPIRKLAVRTTGWNFVRYPNHTWIYGEKTHVTMVLAKAEGWLYAHAIRDRVGFWQHSQRKVLHHVRSYLRYKRQTRRIMKVFFLYCMISRHASTSVNSSTGALL